MQNIWETDKYYEISKKASTQNIHPKILEVKEIAKNCKQVLEVGCGEGSKLDFVCGHKPKGTGVDISTKAITLASKQFPAQKFIKANGEKLPFADNLFDLVYSFFTLEHTQNPEKVIQEMTRVTINGGYLALLAPNYGAPFRRSPCYTGKRIKKIARGIYLDLFGVPGSNNLNWLNVRPIANVENFQIDFDTTVEPYIGSLISYFQPKKGKIILSSSCWEIPENNEAFINKIFRSLAAWQIHPFINWGPHLFLLWKKT